jgi:hypothetical protein
LWSYQRTRRREEHIPLIRINGPQARPAGAEKRNWRVVLYIRLRSYQRTRRQSEEHILVDTDQRQEMAAAERPKEKEKDRQVQKKNRYSRLSYKVKGFFVKRKELIDQK